MKRLIALLLAPFAAALSVSPSLAQQPVKTELVDINGERTDRLLLRYNIDATWVIDDRNILYRDTSRGHYLVTLREACERITVRKPFTFQPADPWRLSEDHPYEIQPWAGSACAVGRIEQVNRETAERLHESAMRRVW